MEHPDPEPRQVDRTRLSSQEGERRILERLCLYCLTGSSCQQLPGKTKRPPVSKEVLTGASIDPTSADTSSGTTVWLAPLSQPPSSKVSFLWTPKAESAFQDLKNRFSSGPCSSTDSTSPSRYLGWRYPTIYPIMSNSLRKEELSRSCPAPDVMPADRPFCAQSCFDSFCLTQP